MIPSSVRRVAAGVATPQSSPVVVSVSSLASAIPLARSHCHQRRYSSSKPSSKSSNSPADVGSNKPSSNNGSSSAHASTVPSSSGEKRKRKAKVATPPAPKLPSVPSTMHIKDEGLALSTFFALHRPISVTQLLPKSVTTDTFAEMFKQRAAQQHSVQDVLSTLSQTVQNLENPQARDQDTNGEQQQQHLQREATAEENHIAKTIYQRALNEESTIQYQLDTMTGQFQPFMPPPPPEPVTEADAAAAAEEISAAMEEQPAVPQTRVYKAMVTIEETVDADGVLKVVAHSPQVMDEDAAPQSTRFLERMALRQLKYEDARARQMEEQQRSPTMIAISVKRQRKLKMKKKKYKKLMKKTRNIRRKLDRL